jgi:uncharacterized linocin/CFP29 family protein
MNQNGAALDGGKQFWGGGSGKWAGEQLIRALSEGQEISPAILRTAGVLRKDEWVAFDEALIEEATTRLRGVADLISAGLTMNIPNSMGKTILEYEKIGQMGDATVSLDGLAATENDLAEFSLSSLPLPITHKDFFINLRKLTASRGRGEALDTTQIRMAGRKIAEAQETMLFNGGKTFGGFPIYGYTNHPNRNTESFGTNGAWSAAAKTGQNILDDVLTMIAASEDANMYGPWVIYVPRDASTKLENDFKANVTQSIRQRIMQVSGVSDVRIADSLATGNVLLVQSEPLQTVQWDIQGGFAVNFKAFQIQVPLVRADSAGQSGIVHMT